MTEVDVIGSSIADLFRLAGLEQAVRGARSHCEALLSASFHTAKVSWVNWHSEHLVVVVVVVWGAGL